MTDYAFYRDVFGGTLLGEEEFGRYAARAGRYLDNITRGRARRDESDEVRLAACAVAEELRSGEGRSIAGETVGKYTVRYGDAPSPGARLYRAAALYLEQTGMLYCGF